MWLYYLLNVNTVLHGLLVLAALGGDMMVEINQKSAVKKALCDNITHVLIGAVSWIIVLHNHKFSSPLVKITAETVLCGIISSLIDVDHFISAGSLHLKDATNLTRRPFFHCSSLPLAISCVVFFLAYWIQSLFLEKISWILITAFTSHHIRDAARRGFWFWPIGSTPPLGTSLYVVLTICLPRLLSTAMNHFTIVLEHSPRYTPVIAVV